MNSGPTAKKAQVSVELIVIIGFILAVFIPIIFFSYLKTAELQQSSSNIYAAGIVNKIANAVETTYYSGDGSRMRFVIIIPDSVKSIYYVPYPGETATDIVANLSDGSSIVAVARAPLDVGQSQMILQMELLTKGVYTLIVENKNNVITIRKDTKPS